MNLYWILALPSYIVLSTLKTWLCYLAVEWLEKNKAGFNKLQRAGAYTFAAYAVGVDFVYNQTTGNLLFAFKHANTLLFTSRLDAVLAGTSAWRKKVAGWICTRLLDNHTASGHAHCRWPNG